MNAISEAKKYRYDNGVPAVILTTNRPSPSDLTVVSMDSKGNVFYHYANGIGEFPSIPVLVEVSPWDEFIKNQIVEVRQSSSLNSSWRLRRFYGVSDDGKPMTFNEMNTKAGPIVWDECRVAEGPPYLED